MRRDRAALEDVAAFAASMPADYRLAFDPVEIATHAAIVARRGSRLTHLEAWDDLPGRVVAVCVVADDRPGLFARISAAIVAHAIDVVRAHAYCRKRGEATEAVDFLWLRRVRAGELDSLGESEIQALGEHLDELVRGERSLGAPVPPPPPRTGTTNVRFARGADGGMILTVEATDRPGLLLAVTQALFRQRLQIVGVRATSERGRAIDRFEVVEHDGSTVGPARALSLQIAVLSAIDGEAKDDVSA